MPASITIEPLQTAADQFRQKTVVPSKRTSDQWEALPAEIRMRSMFSAQVESERILAEAKARLQSRLDLEKRDGRTMDRGVFIEEMRNILLDSGYRRPKGVKRGSLRDLKSSRRLGLIFDMNVAQAQGYAKWKLGMTPQGLANEPAQELVRIKSKIEVRNWPQIWRYVGGKFFGGYGANKDYPASHGRMIALKTDPIWTQISRFGTPWPPFDWGSGMGLRNIDRREAEALGLITPEDTLEPLDSPFNENLEASLASIPEDGRERIAEALQGEVMVEDDKLKLLPPPTPTSRVFLPSAIIGAVMITAAKALLELPEGKLIALAKALDESVAWQRFKSSIENQGGEVLTRDGLVRAMAQFIATPEAKTAIEEIRRSSWRDAFWCPADFADIAAILEGGMA